MNDQVTCRKCGRRHGGKLHEACSFRPGGTLTYTRCRVCGHVYDASIIPQCPNRHVVAQLSGSGKAARMDTPLSFVGVLRPASVGVLWLAVVVMTVLVPLVTVGAWYFRYSTEHERAVRDRLYATIIESADRAKFGYSPNKDLIGTSIGSYYSRATLPKVMVACIDWLNDSPLRFSGGIAVQTASGIVKNHDEQRRIAIDNCQGHRGLKECVCSVVDVDGKNNLEIPSGWAQKFTGK